jgi:two-component system response regulator HydG
MANILLIEDDNTFINILVGFLTKKGFSVEVHSSIKDAVTVLEKYEYQLVLLDYRLPDGTGLDLIKWISSNEIKTPVIVLTSFHDIRTAINAVKAGAFDYITKPIVPDELILIIQQAMNIESKTKEVSISSPVTFPKFVEGKSQKSLQLIEYIKQIAPTDVSVIIQGESGSGKSHIARNIHELSSRSDKPFVSVDCTVLTNELAMGELFGYKKGTFENAEEDKISLLQKADGGTLFLDEIGNLNTEIQLKILRVLQEKAIFTIGSNSPVNIDIRLLAATGDDLIRKVKKGEFSEDLYNLINEFKILVPSLRDRENDIEEFVKYLIRQFNLELNKDILGVSEEVMLIFKRYWWPGNIRELKNTIKRCVLLSKDNVIQKETLPEDLIYVISQHPLSSIYDLKILQENNEKELITRMLKDLKYNKSKVATLLNIEKKTLLEKISKYGIIE